MKARIAEVNIGNIENRMQQLEQLGLQDYLLLVAIPSVTANILDRMRILPYDYYSSPWEYEADLAGGVVSQELQYNLKSRDYESWAGTVNSFITLQPRLSQIQHLK